MENIESVIAMVVNLEKRVEELEKIILKNKSIISESGLHPTKNLSVKEFIILKNPSGDVQKSLSIAYFLEKNEGFNSFNVDDLAHYFQLAKEPTPQNLNDKINMNIKKGHIMEAKEKKENKKAWVITNMGEQFVNNNFKEAK